jgi:serine/threonine protein kinase
VNGRRADAELLDLTGTIVVSGNDAAVRYRLQQRIGYGAHGVVFSAVREGPRPERVTVKVLRPHAIRGTSALAELTIKKELEALRRLMADGKPSPYVVRFLDTGSVQTPGVALDLPWIATEFVEGGSGGLTLRERVERSLAETGSAFALARMRNAVQCVSCGLAAIHELGILHRDVAPKNVLCTGQGRDEVLKLSDFGLARVATAATFGQVMLGTPGYGAHEQSFPEKVGAGPHSDVFGFACTVFYALTGEAYFRADSIPETLVAVYSPSRRDLRECPGLHPELKEPEGFARQLNEHLAKATRPNPAERFQSAREFAEALLSA